jgi:hypothetical protein
MGIIRQARTWRFQDGGNAVCIIRTRGHASDAEDDQDEHGRRERDDAGEKREAAILVFACARRARAGRDARCGHARIVGIAPSRDGAPFDGAHPKAAYHTLTLQSGTAIYPYGTARDLSARPASRGWNTGISEPRIQCVIRPQAPRSHPPACSFVVASMPAS